jgi:hypothetical protein
MPITFEQQLLFEFRLSPEHLDRPLDRTFRGDGWRRQKRHGENEASG